MHGNVWEWCRDWYGDYSKRPVTDPQDSDSGDYRALCGGSWILNGVYCRSAIRGDNPPATACEGTGFRLARGHKAS